MDTARFLKGAAEGILAEATESLRRAHVEHYERIGRQETASRLADLLELVVQGVATRDVAPMIRFAQQTASARFSSGFDLRETQAAFNALEEAIWRSVLENVRPADLAAALGLISTVVGMGKDALAREYVSLASSTKAPSLDLRAMFKGTDGV